MQADFGKQALVECIGKLYVTDTEEVAAFDVIIRIQVVDRVLGVQQRLGIGSTFPVPTVQPLFEVVELGEVVVIPRAEYLVTALSHHVDPQRPVLVVHSEGETVSYFRGRITYHGTVFRSNFSVSVDICEFQVTGGDGGERVLGRCVYVGLRLINAFYLITVEVTDRIACHCITLLLVSGDDRVSFLNQTLHFILDGGQVGTDRISPFADLVAPGHSHFYSFILNLSQVTYPRNCSGNTGNFGQQVFRILHIINTFKMQSVAEKIRFKSGFPSFHFFPTEIRIGQIGKLIARIDDRRFAEYGGISVAQ